MPDPLAQFLAENVEATQSTSTSIVTPLGIVTITVEFEPYEADE